MRDAKDKGIRRFKYLERPLVDQDVTCDYLVIA